MSLTTFEILENRQLMSTSALVDETGLFPNRSPDQAPAAVKMSLLHPITRATGGVDVSKMVGKFRESGGSSFFKDHVTIKRVASSGSVKGTFSIAWIVNDASLRGVIRSDGKFSLKFEKDRTGQGDWVGGTFKGKLSADGKKLTGMVDWGYSKDGSGGAAPYKETFIKYGKGA